jgi:hypothetical protein
MGFLLGALEAKQTLILLAVGGPQGRGSEAFLFAVLGICLFGIAAALRVKKAVPSSRRVEKGLLSHSRNEGIPVARPVHLGAVSRVRNIAPGPVEIST